MSRNGARDQRNGGRGTGRGRELRRRRTWPTVTALEDRRLMATFTVTNTADSGAGSLPYEIGLANSTTGANTVDFDCGVFQHAADDQPDRRSARIEQHERVANHHGARGGRDRRAPAA